MSFPNYQKEHNKDGYQITVFNALCEYVLNEIAGDFDCTIQMVSYNANSKTFKIIRGFDLIGDKHTFFRYLDWFQNEYKPNAKTLLRKFYLQTNN